MLICARNCVPVGYFAISRDCYNIKLYIREVRFVIGSFNGLWYHDEDARFVIQEYLRVFDFSGFYTSEAEKTVVKDVVMMF